jgi:hypothetical protein
MLQPTMQHAAFGDVMGGLIIAGAISTALYKRCATGRPSIMDAKLNPDARPYVHDRKATWNPLVNSYRSAPRLP